MHASLMMVTSTATGSCAAAHEYKEKVTQRVASFRSVNTAAYDILIFLNVYFWTLCVCEIHGTNLKYKLQIPMKHLDEANRGFN